MFDRTSRLVSYGSGMALAVAVVATTSAHQHAQRAPVNDTATQHSSSAVDDGQGVPSQPGAAVTKISFEPGCFHHYP